MEPLVQDAAVMQGDSAEPELIEQRVLPDVEEGEPRERPSDTVTVQDVVLSAQSSIQALKAACEHLQLKTSGSKTRLFLRIQGYLEKQQIALQQDMASDARSGEERRPQAQPLPRPPSEAERLIHEITHLPYASWCPHCISMRAMPDRSEAAQQPPRDVPTVSFDFFYTGYDAEAHTMQSHGKPGDGENSDDLLCCLVAHDSSTGSVVAIPCQSKGTTRFLGVELMRFIHGLGHTTVELRCDNEPSTISLQTAVAGARKRLGLRTIIRNPPVGAHASNGAVEKSVDVIRSLANTMMSMVRERVGIDFGADHALFAWSFVHASWTRNRFAAVGGLTAYERATNARYTGRLVCFGEPVFGQISVKKKGNARWVRCVFLSKTISNDMFIVATRAGVRLCRSVRRTSSEWAVDRALYQGLAGFPWDYSSGAVGTRLVPPARTRRPQIAATAGDEAASDPPTPVPSGDGLASPPPAAEGDVPTLGVGPSIEGDALPLPVAAATGPPPGTAVAEIPVQPVEMGPNPALGAPDVEMLRTPEAMLPPLGDTAQGSAGSRDVPAEAGGDRKRIRLRAVQFGSHNLDYHDDDVALDFPELERGELCEQIEADIDNERPAAGEYAGDGSEGTTALNVQGPPSELEQLQAQLWFEDHGGPPELSEEQLAALDRIADEVEIQRLSKKAVIRPVEIDEEEGPLMLHVDDNLILCPLTWLHESLVPLIKSRFQATVEIAYRVGDQISFLKRVHTLTETGMKIAISDHYAKSMAKILEIRGGTAQTPDLAEFSGHDTSHALSEQQASKYRSVVGIALYVSADRPDIAHSVRKLSSVMASPTALAWRAAIRLTQYLLATASYALHLEPGEPGSSILHGAVVPGGDLLECYTDADWSGSKADRKSIGSSTHCINGAVVYFATRTQRSVSLSSMESEWYACVSGCCDALFIREVWEFISGQSAQMHVLLDNQSARALAKRQGAAKQAKHIAGRLLWIQDYVKRGIFAILSVPTATNLADIGTKGLAKARLRALMYMHNFVDDRDDERAT
ncbi:RE1 [Symbiodinium sp. CCMP2456]|nr:RE1 [Symbiodinium sp. CCMP2456]